MPILWGITGKRDAVLWCNPLPVLQTQIWTAMYYWVARAMDHRVFWLVISGPPPPLIQPSSSTRRAGGRALSSSCRTFVARRGEEAGWRGREWRGCWLRRGGTGRGLECGVMVRLCLVSSGRGQACRKIAFYVQITAPSGDYTLIHPTFMCPESEIKAKYLSK